VTASASTSAAAALRGARWYTAAFTAVGVLNYGYALLLTRLLDVADYTRFAAGQGLVLGASAVATVMVPWVLAQTLARAGTGAEREDAIRFAGISSVIGGGLAAGVVAAVASRFAGPAASSAVAASTLLIFLSTVAFGRLQGTERQRAMSALTIAEVCLKCAAGVLLVTVARLGDVGALAAFGVGALPCLLWWPLPRRGSGALWRNAVADRDLWRRALGVGGVQGMVALLGAIDPVMVTVLPDDRAAAASYQASVVLARVPVFLASAISMAFLPALSRRRSSRMLVRRAIGLYLVVALPVSAVFATAPGAVLAVAFPARYAMISVLLRYTAISGFAIGGLSLLTTFFQAVDDFSCLWWQCVGLLGYAIALGAGWTLGGVPGLAAGAACGALGALLLLACRLVRRSGWEVLGRIPLLELLVLIALLAATRPYPALWLVTAALAGLRAAARFLRRSESLDDTPPRSGLPEG
jgi:O-antigen/teichoic acid export membrane protein